MFAIGRTLPKRLFVFVIVGASQQKNQLKKGAFQSPKTLFWNRLPRSKALCLGQCAGADRMWQRKQKTNHWASHQALSLQDAEVSQGFGRLFTVNH